MKQFAFGAGFALLIALAFFFWLRGQHKAEIASYSSISQADRDSIRHFKNKAGESIAEAVQARSSLQVYQQTHPEEISQILKDFGVRPSDLRHVLRASFQAQNQGSAIVRIHHYDTLRIAGKPEVILRGDTIETKIYDGYLDLKSTIVRGEDFWGDQAEWKYLYTDTLSVIGKVKHKGLFRKESYFVNAMLKNPRAQVTSLRDVEVAEFKDKRFGVGPAVIYDPLSGTVRVGIGISYNLFKF